MKNKYDGKGNNKHAKVMIAVPGAEWKGDFGMSLISLIAASENPIEGFDQLELGIHNAKGSLLPQLRQKLVDAAQEAEATHILFLDTDMKFPPHTLGILLEHNKDIVACNCPTKLLPSTPTARLAPCEFAPKGTPVYQEDFLEREDPLLQVWRVGTGIMMVKMEVFANISMPNFPISYTQENGFVGEDWGFCELAEKAGYEIFIDVHLSHAIEHVGNLAFTHGMVKR